MAGIAYITQVTGIKEIRLYRCTTMQDANSFTYNPLVAAWVLTYPLRRGGRFTRVSRWASGAWWAIYSVQLCYCRNLNDYLSEVRTHEFVWESTYNNLSYIFRPNYNSTKTYRNLLTDSFASLIQSYY